mmetsp:Transcript_14964/g.50635  ORF Transcript_14964/g.50635 Transcript_14964/m.50635 type:complete len:217 (-) Transcript_14964:193-843(-)
MTSWLSASCPVVAVMPMCARRSHPGDRRDSSTVAHSRHSPALDASTATVSVVPSTVTLSRLMSSTVKSPRVLEYRTLASQPCTFSIISSRVRVPSLVTTAMSRCCLEDSVFLNVSTMMPTPEKRSVKPWNSPSTWKPCWTTHRAIPSPKRDLPWPEIRNLSTVLAEFTPSALRLQMAPRRLWRSGVTRTKNWFTSAVPPVLHCLATTRLPVPSCES